MNVVKNITPNRKQMNPISLVASKSFAVIILLEYPSVVIITTLTKAKSEIKKEHADKIVTIKILFPKRVFIFDTKRLATIAIEKPPSSEVIVINWLASLLRYSNSISVIV